jgi:hypothetical protein
MIIFYKVLPRPFKCITKLLKRPVENFWVRYSTGRQQIAGKQNGRVARSL